MAKSATQPPNRPPLSSGLGEITARKQAEEALLKAGALQTAIFNSANFSSIATDAKGVIQIFNVGAERMLGYAATDVMNKITPADISDPQELVARAQALSAELGTPITPGFEALVFKASRGIEDIYELTYIRKDGSRFPAVVSVMALRDDQNEIIGYLLIGTDNTARKQAEAKILETQAELQRLLDAANQSRRALLSVIQDQKRAEAAIQHANRALATLSTVNRTLVHATDENELLQAICDAIVEQKGYRLVWVGYVQHDENKSIKIMARAGHDEGYLDTIQLTWAETERGMGPSGRAVRSGATQVCQDITNDPHYSPWRDEALKRGYAASIALPLTNGSNSKVFGILNVYAAEANAFTSTEIDLMEEMAGDMAFGVRSLHTSHERDLALVKNQEQVVQLQDSLEDTMRAIASIVEMRDPYTAGHQSRVADLAAAIARQMGLPGEQAHAIHLAGTVHDLGKIQIPAEILSKPGKISDIEFSFIKTHAQAGYDILKDINFPWPIAQMVLQHHERLDGSGYPQGLKGEAILLEARILAVADVVEAISAHRPYRAGLGNDAAMEEITRNRGKFYDPQVVDACLALFREQGYSFK